MAVLWRQWRAERALARRGIRFRQTDPAQAAAAYAAMTDAEFDAVNARQDWANWRTIPRALSGHVPDRPLRVLDLGCGAGSSTQVLAFYCPPGSRITGYDVVEPLLAVARRRAYRHRGGQSADVRFVCQRVNQPFREADATMVSDRSVDVINASGVVGHNLDIDSFRPLLAEARRVLAAHGIAQLDVGPTIGPAVLLEIMESAAFVFLGHYRSWLFDPTGQMAFAANH